MTLSSTIRRNCVHLAFLAVSTGMVIAAACASSGHAGDFDGGPGDDGGSPDSPNLDGFHLGGGDDGGGVNLSSCTSADPCDDFSGSAGADCSKGECVVVVTGAPSNAPTLFTGTPSTSGLCLIEPQDGTLFPNSWLRPRVSYAPASSSDTLFQIRFHSTVEKNDLVVYTTQSSWTLDKPTWLALSKNLVGPTITVTVSGTGGSGGPVNVSAPANFTIASLPAEGALIYWTTANHDNSATSTNLKGFHVGDEGTTVALTSSQVTQQVGAVDVANDNVNNKPVAVFCIGCHTATPDGNYVGFTAQWPWPNAMASVNAGDAGTGVAALGQPPPWLTAAAMVNLSPMLGPATANVTPPTSGSVVFYSPPIVNQIMLGIQTFSAEHYASGDHVVVTTLGAAQNALSLDSGITMTGVQSQLAWVNLEWPGPLTAATAAGTPIAPCGTDPAPPSACFTQTPNDGWGLITRTGDSQSAAAPSWSHGKVDTIAYASTDNGAEDGRLQSGNTDVYLVPYNSNGPGKGGAGGTATPLAGASSSSFNEYYPAYSPDDELIAFNRVPSGVTMYNQPQAEVAVVNALGKSVTCDGVATSTCRLKANDPVSCTGSVSPGVQNTWPKWAPLPNTASTGMAGNQGKDGKLYYWVTFSSTRGTACTVSSPDNSVCNGDEESGALGKAQLFVAGVVVDPTSGAITTYPAIYLWNQDASLNNLIPAWEFFPIPAGSSPPIN